MNGSPPIGLGGKDGASRDLPHASLSRFARFCLVGASGVVVDSCALLTLASIGVPWGSIVLAKALAAELALLNNFWWNELWTFREPPGRLGGNERLERPGRQGLWGRLMRFHGICGLGIVISTVLFRTFHVGLGVPMMLANLLAIGVTTMWNFGMNARFNWGRSGPGRRES